MKTNKIPVIRVSATLLCLLILFAAVSCKSNPPADLWENAIHTENKSLGSGALTVIVEVKAGEKSIELTIKTDKTILADALLENNLVEGEEGAFGLYIKSVNGIKADYDTDGAYWALLKNGEYADAGADSTTITDGEHYELVYTKG